MQNVPRLKARLQNVVIDIHSVICKLVFVSASPLLVKCPPPLGMFHRIFSWIKISQVYVVTVAGKEVAKRRYSEFLTLYNELEKIFTDFEFPKFPGKWPFQMSDQQLEKRRNALNNFIRNSKDLSLFCDNEKAMCLVCTVYAVARPHHSQIL